MSGWFILYKTFKLLIIFSNENQSPAPSPRLVYFNVLFGHTLAYFFGGIIDEENKVLRFDT